MKEELKNKLKPVIDFFKNKKVQNELRFNEEEIEYIMNGKH